MYSKYITNQIRDVINVAPQKKKEISIVNPFFKYLFAFNLKILAIVIYYI